MMMSMLFLQWRVDSQVDTNIYEEHTSSIFSPEDRDGISVRNAGTYLRIHTASKADRASAALQLQGYVTILLAGKYDPCYTLVGILPGIFTNAYKQPRGAISPFHAQN
jgi:hypothetical protein